MQDSPQLRLYMFSVVQCSFPALRDAHKLLTVLTAVTCQGALASWEVGTTTLESKRYIGSFQVHVHVQLTSSCMSQACPNE